MTAQVYAAKGLQEVEAGIDASSINNSVIVSLAMLSRAAYGGNSDAALLVAYVKDYDAQSGAWLPASAINRQRMETAYLLAACLGSRMAFVRMGERLLTERGRHGTDLLRRYQFQADGYADALTDALRSDVEASTEIMESLLRRRVNVDRFVVDYADTEVHSLARLSLSMVSLMYRAELIAWASRIANDRGSDANFRFQYALVDEAEGFAILHCRETLMALQYRNVVAVYPKQLLFVDQFGEEIVQPY